MFYLRLFGCPSIERVDRALMGRAAQRHRIALLALLALAPGRRMTRDKLMGQLWPERDSGHARNLLKQATYVLRSELGEQALSSERDELRLNEKVVTSDTALFEAALARMDFQEAVRLYRGPFMDGFFLADAEEFEEWVAQERRRFAGAYAGALESLGAAAATAGDWPGAAEWWKLRAAQDPFDTRVALRVMETLAAAGNPAGALQHAAGHQRVLWEELGMEAPAELTAAVEHLRHATLPAVAAFAELPPVAGTMSGQPASVEGNPATGPASLPEPPPSVATRLVSAPRRRRLAAAAVLLLLATAVVVITRSGSPADDPPAGSDSEYSARNPDAYQLYLRGRYFWNKRTEADVSRAHQYFEQALELDPGFALAWAGVADVWISRGWYARLPPRETFPRAKRAALMALEFDSTLAAAHASLAHTHLRFDFDWAAAEREYRRAIELEPGNAIAHHWYGGLLSVLGRHREALAQADTALELDPLAPIIQTWHGLHRYFARDYQGAIREYARAVRLNENFAPARWHLGWAYLEMGRGAEAMAEARRAVTIDPDNLAYQAAVGYAAARAGMTEEARATLARLEVAARTRYLSAYEVALIHAALGDTDEALDSLERAFAERAVMMPYLRVDPRLDPLRDEPRFRTLLVQMRLDF